MNPDTSGAPQELESMKLETLDIKTLQPGDTLAITTKDKQGGTGSSYIISITAIDKAGGSAITNFTKTWKDGTGETVTGASMVAETVGIGSTIRFLVNISKDNIRNLKTAPILTITVTKAPPKEATAAQSTEAAAVPDAPITLRTGTPPHLELPPGILDDEPTLKP